MRTSGVGSLWSYFLWSARSLPVLSSRSVGRLSSSSSALSDRQRHPPPAMPTRYLRSGGSLLGSTSGSPVAVGSPTAPGSSGWSGEVADGEVPSAAAEVNSGVP
jgi:hypothetical protein